MEASVALGADDSRLPAVTVFFQHLERRDVVAAGLVDGSTALANHYLCGLFMERRWQCCRLADYPHCCAAQPDAHLRLLAGADIGGPRSATEADRLVCSLSIFLARAAERLTASRHLAACLPRQSYRMARRAISAAARWHVGKGK